MGLGGLGFRERALWLSVSSTHQSPAAASASEAAAQLASSASDQRSCWVWTKLIMPLLMNSLSTSVSPPRLVGMSAAPQSSADHLSNTHVRQVSAQPPSAKLLRLPFFISAGGVGVL